MVRFEFTQQEKEETLALYSEVRALLGDALKKDDEQLMRHHLVRAIEEQQMHRNVFGLNPVLFGFQTAQLVVEATPRQPFREVTLSISLP